MRIGVVEEFGDERMVVERLLHDAALNATSAAMDEPKPPKTGRVRRRHVFVDDRWNVIGREGVEIETVFDGNPERVLILHRFRWRRAARSAPSLPF